MITWQTIDDVLIRMESNPISEEEMKKMQKSQPWLLAYVFSDTFDILTDEERDLFLFLFVVSYKSFHKTYGELSTVISEDEIGDCEEKLWSSWEELDSKSFNAHVDAFYDTLKESDLIDFLADSLITENQEDIMSGRELMLVGLCTCMEVMGKDS